MSFSYKVHKTGTETLLAVADSDLVGQSFSDNEKEISIAADFYEEKKADAGTIAGLAEAATIVNAMGQKIIDLLVERGIVSREDTIEVCGVPHAQVFLIR